jgi:vancomycin resistance protein YoaR
MKQRAIKINWQYITLFVLLTTLIIAYFCLDPFSNVLVSNTAPINQLTAAQRSNIALASEKLNGIIVMPGRIFSFNKTIGPRTAQEGYSKSPSYLEGDSPMTFGGGICLLSSILYKSALELGLNINERQAHTRTTQCIAPGFDATVWYGLRDLNLPIIKKLL